MKKAQKSGLDKKILEDPIVKELAKLPFKEYNSESDIANIYDRSSSSGLKGTLQRVRIRKGLRHIEYFKKKFTRFQIPMGDTYSALSMQEFIASELYRITGCIAPKQKLFLKQNMYHKVYGTRIDSGSKKIRFQQLSKKIQLDEYIDDCISHKSYKELKEASKLMAAVLVVGDYDRNSRNYYLDSEQYMLGKMDHDRTFARPLNHNYFYAEPDYLVHVYFIEKLCNKESTTDEHHLKMTKNHGRNIVHDSISMNTGYHTFDDVLFRINDDKNNNNPLDLNEWRYNKSFFDDKTIDMLKREPIMNFMFVSYIKTIKKFIDMPKEIREQLFSPEKLLKDVWEKLPKITQDDLISHCVERNPKFVQGEIKTNFFIGLLNEQDTLTKYMRSQIFQNYPGIKTWDEDKLIVGMNKIVLNDAQLYKQFDNIDQLVENNQRIKSIYENTNRSQIDIQKLNRFLLDCKYTVDIERNKLDLLSRFEENLSALEEMIELPLTRIKELEDELKNNGLPIPEIKVDYSPAVKFIQAAREKNISLHELKVEIKTEAKLHRFNRIGPFW